MSAIHMTESGLGKYLAEMKKFPMLDAEEERRLFLAWRDRGDQEALQQLLGSHLRLVVKIARSFSGYGLPIEELIAEGNLGLMQAAEKFDPDRGFRFATYAMWWIRAAIQEYILHSWSLVKMGTTAAQKKLFFNLRKLKAQMQHLESGDLPAETVTAIARELDVPEYEVVEMNRRLAAADASLNVGIGEEGDADWMSMLADDQPSQEARVIEASERALRNRLLGEALERLNERERDILVHRRLIDDPMTLEDLSERYGISRERVRQIEVRAFDKLQKSVVGANRALRQAVSQNLMPEAA